MNDTAMPTCPIHGSDHQPELCAACSIALLVARVASGDPLSSIEPRKTFVDTRGMRPDGTGIIVWNQRLDDDLD